MNIDFIVDFPARLACSVYSKFRVRINNHIKGFRFNFNLWNYLVIICAVLKRNMLVTGNSYEKRT